MLLSGGPGQALGDAGVYGRVAMPSPGSSACSCAHCLPPTPPPPQQDTCPSVTQTGSLTALAEFSITGHCSSWFLFCPFGARGTRSAGALGGHCGWADHAETTAPSGVCFGCQGFPAGAMGNLLTP